MSSAYNITLRLIEEGINARAHFQIWWTLRNLAIPKYLPVMNNVEYVDFFHAANSGHYTLFLLALAKVFDRDSRVAGISELKRALRTEGKSNLALQVAREMKPIEAYVKRLMRIRNRSVVHNEHAISREAVYELNGVTPNQLFEVIETACRSINLVAQALEIETSIFESNRAEQATINLLKTLERGSA